MSKLLDDLIKQKRDDKKSYEIFLKKAEELARKMAKGHSNSDIPAALHGKQGATAIYNNLPDLMPDEIMKDCVKDRISEYGDPQLVLALEIDKAMHQQAPADWKGDETRENQVLNALFPLLNRNREATLALFEIVKNQSDYL